MKAQNLERIIKESQRLLSKGIIHVSRFGMYGLVDNSDAVIGFGRNALWQEEKLFETQDAFHRVTPPAEFWERDDSSELIKRNQRAILHDFGIKVYCFKDKLEVRGFLPPTTVQVPGDNVSTSAWDN